MLPRAAVVAMALALPGIPSLAHARDATVAEDSPARATLSSLPGGVLHQIRSHLPLRQQHFFQHRLSRKLEAKLNRLKHLAPEPLRKEEQNFFSYQQYIGAVHSGRYQIDSVRLKFSNKKDCAHFLSSPDAPERIKSLRLNALCTAEFLTQWQKDRGFKNRKPWSDALESLTLETKAAGESFATAFPQMLNSLGFEKLKVLKLKLSTEHRADLSSLPDALSRLPSLEKLSITGRIDREFLIDLMEAKPLESQGSKKNPRGLRLKALSLKDCWLDAEDINTVLAPFLTEQAETLEALSLSLWDLDGGDWDGGEVDLGDLLGAIASAKHLQRLSFSNLFSASHPITPAWTSLYQIKTLKSLKLGRGDLRGDRLLAFKELLAQNPLVEELSVRNALLDADAILTLDNELQKLSRLRKLDFSGNWQIQALGFYRLLNALPEDNQLEELVLDSCQITNYYFRTTPWGPQPPPAEVSPTELKRLSSKLAALKRLSLKNNRLLQEPGFLRRCLGAFCLPPTPSLLSVFRNSKLTHFQLCHHSGSDCGMDYALDFDSDWNRLTHLDLGLSDVKAILNAPFYRSVPIDLSQIKSLHLTQSFDSRNEFLQDPTRFYEKFPNLESLEWKAVNKEFYTQLFKALPPGLRFVKLSSSSPIRAETLKLAQRALRIKGIHLYDFPVLE